MKQRKIPMRKCIITKESLPKQELLRVVRTTEKTVVVDETGKVNGRGAYIKKDITLIDKLKKSKLLDRHLEIEVEDSVYEEIKKYC